MDLEITISETNTPSGPTGEYVVMAGEKWKAKDVILENASFEQAIFAAKKFIENIGAA